MEEGEFAIYHPALRLVRMLTKGIFVSECQTQTGEIVYADNHRMDKPYTPPDAIVGSWPEPNPNREVKTHG